MKSRLALHFLRPFPYMQNQKDSSIADANQSDLDSCTQKDRQRVENVKNRQGTGKQGAADSNG